MTKLGVQFGYLRTTGQVAVRVVLPEADLDLVADGPFMTPPEDVAPWADDIATSFIASNVLEKTSRSWVLDRARATYVPLGFTWSGLPGRLPHPEDAS